VRLRLPSHIFDAELRYSRWLEARRRINHPSFHPTLAEETHAGKSYSKSIDLDVKALKLTP
jgi:hypothetical protein